MNKFVLCISFVHLGKKDNLNSSLNTTDYSYLQMLLNCLLALHTEGEDMIKGDGQGGEIGRGNGKNTPSI